jgi:transcription elongation factor GreA
MRASKDYNLFTIISFCLIIIFMEKYFTKQGLQKFKKELDYLEKVKRKEVIEKIKYAADQGDLSENAGYTTAKEEQSFIESRIKELKEIVAQAQVIHGSSNGKVEPGSIIYLESKEGKEKYQIVASEEADILAGKVSSQSPFGRSFLGKKQGDVVEINVPAGKKKYKIIKVV